MFIKWAKEYLFHVIVGIFVPNLLLFKKKISLNQKDVDLASTRKFKVHLFTSCLVQLVNK